MRRTTFRSFIAGLAFTLVLGNNLPAGAIAEAVGKGWDKAVGKMVKAHDTCQSHIKGAMGKVKGAKPVRAGGCCKGN